LCADATITWLTNNCRNVSKSYVEATIKNRSRVVEWCNAPNTTACKSSFPTFRVLYSAGNSALSLQVASGKFLTSTIDATFATKIMNAAFSKNVGGQGNCAITPSGSVCGGIVPLLAVPGLLISTTPGFAPGPLF
jgi:hypothetical protein